MRSGATGQDLAVRAIAGSHVVTLGFDVTAKGKKGLLGFSVRRKRHGDGDERWLQGPLGFPGAPEGKSADAANAPIQQFQWGDYTATPGEKYTYTVAAVYGAPSALREGEKVEVTISTENEDDGKHAIYFNRGVAGSQAYSRQFLANRKFYWVEKFGRGNWVPFIKPGDIPDGAAWKWLSRGLEEALLRYLAQATGPSFSIRASVYEFDHLPVIQAFVAALERGVDVKIIYDAKESASGPVKATEAALRKVGLSKLESVEAFGKMMIKRTDTTISHNKYVILIEKGVPKQVWTGSTNITSGGIYGQSNVGHIVRDEGVAAKYLAYWEKLSSDPKHKSLKAEPPDLGITNWNVLKQPDLVDAPPPPNSITPIFSPRPTVAMLEWYASMLASARNSSHFTAAFGVSTEIQARLSKKEPIDDDRPYLRYILLESRPDKQAQKAAAKAGVKPADPAAETLPPYYDSVKLPQNRIAFGAVLKNRADDISLEEDLSGLNMNVEYLHTKYMLVDPLSDDPIVITGSANFSDASTTKNDENMLVIRGDTRVADIFLTEFMRLFNHFAVRNRLNRLSDKALKASSSLATDDSWTEPFFRPGAQECAERLLFSGFRKS